MSAVNLCLARCRDGGGGKEEEEEEEEVGGGSIGKAVSELPGYPGLEPATGRGRGGQRDRFSGTTITSPPTSSCIAI